MSVVTQGHLCGTDMRWLHVIVHTVHYDSVNQMSRTFARKCTKPCKFRYVKPVGNFIRRYSTWRKKTRIFDNCTHLTSPNQRTPTNINISLISYIARNHRLWTTSLPVTIYAHLHLLKKKSHLKTSTSTLNDSIWNLTAFYAKLLFRVIQGHLFWIFDVDEKPVGDYILRHDSFCLIYEILKDIATTKCQNGKFGWHHSHMMPRASDPPRISA